LNKQKRAASWPPASQTVRSSHYALSPSSPSSRIGWPSSPPLLFRLAVLLVLLTLPILLALTALLAGLTALGRFAALLPGLARLTLLLAGFAGGTLLTSVIAVAILVVRITHDSFLFGYPAR
jgi:hypothetical protein